MPTWHTPAQVPTGLDLEVQSPSGLEPHTQGCHSPTSACDPLLGSGAGLPASLASMGPGPWGDVERAWGELGLLQVEPGKCLLPEGRLLIQLPPAGRGAQNTPWGRRHLRNTWNMLRNTGKVPVSQLMT